MSQAIVSTHINDLIPKNLDDIIRANRDKCDSRRNRKVIAQAAGQRERNRTALGYIYH